MFVSFSFAMSLVQKVTNSLDMSGGPQGDKLFATSKGSESDKQFSLSGGPQGDKLFVTSKVHNKPIIMSLTQ